MSRVRREVKRQGAELAWFPCFAVKCRALRYLKEGRTMRLRAEDLWSKAVAGTSRPTGEGAGRSTGEAVLRFTQDYRR